MSLKPVQFLIAAPTVRRRVKNLLVGTKIELPRQGTGVGQSIHRMAAALKDDRPYFLIEETRGGKIVCQYLCPVSHESRAAWLHRSRA